MKEKWDCCKMKNYFTAVPFFYIIGNCLLLFLPYQSLAFENLCILSFERKKCIIQTISIGKKEKDSKLKSEREKQNYQRKKLKVN